MHYTIIKDKYECDFALLCNNKLSELIQVCYTMKDPDTQTREVRPLIQLCKNHKLSQATIITYDEENTLLIDGVTINVIPAYKYFLKLSKTNHPNTLKPT